MILQQKRVKMLTDPSIWVVCDKCGLEEEVPLTSCARGSWDERNVETLLITWGWEVDTNIDYHVCPSCVAEEEE